MTDDKCLLEYSTNEMNPTCVPSVDTMHNMNLSSRLLQSSLLPLLMKLNKFATNFGLRSINSENVNKKMLDSYPIHWAAFGGDTRTIKRLVDLGANIHNVNDKGETALHFASMAGHVDAIKLLLELGSNVSRSSKSGDTALDYATILGVKSNADAIRVLQHQMNKHFPPTVSHTETFDYREKVCIGRALAVHFAPLTQPTRNFVESPFPDTIDLTSVWELEQTVSAFIRRRPKTVTVVEPPPELCIPRHFTCILMYYHNSSYYIWYMNPWGFKGDASWYKRKNKKHPIEAIQEYVQTFVIRWSWWSNYNIVVIDPETSMTSNGPQNKSSGTLREKNSGISDSTIGRGRGTCLTWGEMYLYDVSQWLDTLEGASLNADEFQTRLKEVFGRNISYHNAFDSVSLFAFHRWANKGIVPQALLYAIYKAIPTDDPAKVTADVVRANEIYLSNEHVYFIDKLTVGEVVRKFLTESGLYSRGVKSVLQADIRRIEYVHRFQKGRRSKSVSSYVVQSTLILVDCKLKAMSWRKDKLVGYKRHFPTFEREESDVKRNRES